MMQMLSIPLTAHHIRFTVRTVTPLRFGDFKGSALRGAFTNILGDTFCPEWRSGQRDPHHQAICPACQLVALERDESTSGDVRRPYAITPPPGAQADFAPGETFAFGMTLFGDALHYLPYLVLAVGGMGERGIGQRVAATSGQPQRGRFVVERIDAVNPFSGQILPMMEPGHTMVQGDTLPVLHAQVLAVAEQMTQELTSPTPTSPRDHFMHGGKNLLRVDFLTPTRITKGNETWKQPDFFAFGKQTVLRVMDLAAQHGGGRPTIDGQPLELRTHIYPYLDQVTLVENHTHWWDLAGYSARVGRKQQIGGLVGSARYHAAD
ncbi:MAG: hypothetical protein KDE47_19800, partial [Caldilineaceae bacterium]|nr:hypothetical protein [Caldilineaceae bacterium]